MLNKIISIPQKIIYELAHVLESTYTYKHHDLLPIQFTIDNKPTIDLLCSRWSLDLYSPTRIPVLPRSTYLPPLYIHGLRKTPNALIDLDFHTVIGKGLTDAINSLDKHTLPLQLEKIETTEHQLSDPEEYLNTSIALTWGTQTKYQQQLIFKRSSLTIRLHQVQHYEYDLALFPDNNPEQVYYASTQAQSFEQVIQTLTQPDIGVLIKNYAQAPGTISRTEILKLLDTLLQLGQAQLQPN